MAEDEAAQPERDRLSIPAASDIERHVSGGIRNRATAPEPPDRNGRAPAERHEPRSDDAAETMTKAGQPGNNP